MSDIEVSNKDILKHYFASIVVYGVIWLLVSIWPLYESVIEKSYWNYSSVLGIYYLLYIIFALPVFFKFRPKSIKDSRAIAILLYIKRQFGRVSALERLKNFEMTEAEKHAFVITFVKAFFGVYCVNMLCTNYIPTFDYNVSFVGAMLNEAVSYSHAQGAIAGFAQFIDDSADMIINLTFLVTTLVFTFSYLTEASFLKNKIKYADITPLGILACILCYYPFTSVVSTFIPLYNQSLIPTPNPILRITFRCLLLLACIVSMIAILRLGTKSGNLTNRGIVKGFPYNIVRHPDYAAQMWILILLFIPVYGVAQVTLLNKILFTFGTIFMLFLYYLRAITEERNLSKDQEYVEYMDKVKRRFIPWVF